MRKFRVRHDIVVLVLSSSIAACDGNETLGGATNAGRPPTPSPSAGAGATSASDVGGMPSPPVQIADAGTATPIEMPGPSSDAGPVDLSNQCPCSRVPGRPHPPAGWTCPGGTGASTATTIGPEGGTLSLETGTEGVTLQLTIPAGALAKPTQIKVTEMPGPTPAGFTDYSPLYLFEPIDTAFSIPAELRVPWSILLQQGVAFEVKRELSIYTSPSPADGFQRLSDSYVNAGFSQASIVKLGYLFVGYPASLDPPVCTAGP